VGRGPLGHRVSNSTSTIDWVRCPSCSAFVYRKRLKRSSGVCPECNHHFRLSLPDRLEQLLDAGSWAPEPEVEPLDVLGFADSKPYPSRLEEAQKKTGLRSGALYGRGAIEGLPLAVVGIEFAFIGGSMSGGVGEAVARAADIALRDRIPLLAISASGGARMQEGVVSLMQMAKTSQAAGRMRAAGLPFICLLTDPTYGGVTASFATLGDVLITEPGAHIGFAGPSVIQQTIRQTLPDGFQTAAFLMERGMVDIVVAREDLKGRLHSLLKAFAAAAAAAGEDDPAARGCRRRPTARCPRSPTPRASSAASRGTSCRPRASPRGRAASS